MAVVETALAPVALKNTETQLDSFRHFIAHQKVCEKQRDVNSWRIAGHPIEINKTTVRIATCDSYKAAIGSVALCPGTFLMMVREDDESPSSFILLRVRDDAEVPLNSQMLQTTFEIGKKSPLNLDIWSANVLQWGALDCDVLGTIYHKGSGHMEFAGDTVGHLAPFRYVIFAPDSVMLNLIINGSANSQNAFRLGYYRPTECEGDSRNDSGQISVYANLEDIVGYRTAVFSKTRGGKTTLVMRIAGAVAAMHGTEKQAGQVIYDMQGEYANAASNFGGDSLKNRYPAQCVVYAITPKEYSKHLQVFKPIQYPH